MLYPIVESSRKSLTAPSSHTTVRAMSHTAVSVKCLTKLFVSRDLLDLAL